MSVSMSVGCYQLWIFGMSKEIKMKSLKYSANATIASTWHSHGLV